VPGTVIEILTLSDTFSLLVFTEQMFEIITIVWYDK